MNNQIGTILIIGVCAGVLLIGAMRKKVEWLLNFVLRAVLGTLSIFLINGSMLRFGMESHVGLNAATVLTSGILGFPGLVLLYGIHFYKSM
ncbi:MAG TPA: pro-sigmaK processing inhibitor BofA family protein [Lachnospiraceae bacterium]|nr:pro-sigmaK processing inhibitor BofA family protein [Lachnospiraceae bacterium]